MYLVRIAVPGPEFEQTKFPMKVDETTITDYSWRRVFIGERKRPFLHQTVARNTLLGPFSLKYSSQQHSLN